MILQDSFLISVSKVFDDLETNGMIGRNTAWYIEQERDRYARKIRVGKVVSVPSGYSGTNYQPIDPGLPNHRIYVGHDQIQQMANIGRKDLPKYNPSAKEQIEFISLADIGALVDVRVGEMVHFHPNVTEPENLHQELETETIYKCYSDALICVGTRMQAGWVLIEPHVESMEQDGFVVAVEAGTKMLEGTVAYIRQREDLKPGDHVFFQENANWEYEVGGKVYFAMREENVWMKLIPQISPSQ